MLQDAGFIFGLIGGAIINNQNIQMRVHLFYFSDYEFYIFLAVINWYSD